MRKDKKKLGICFQEPGGKSFGTDGRRCMPTLKSPSADKRIRSSVSCWIKHNAFVINTQYFTTHLTINEIRQ